MPTQFEVFEAIRAACLDAACKAYEDAGISGLCGEGRWEMAIPAIRNLDVQAVLDSVEHSPSPDS